MLIHKINCKMTMLISRLEWMKSSCKSHFYAITIASWCNILLCNYNFMQFIQGDQGLQQVTSDNYN
jgi:hypothetical protein